jgi:hypothetical protein
VAALAATVLLLAVIAWPYLMVDSATAETSTQKDRFTVSCKFSHRAKDDPIMFPGQPGASHSHDFLANRSTSARSTYTSLLAAETNCNREEDTAAYWVPTLYQNGRALAPSDAKIYYSSQVDSKSVRAFPPDLRMITGNPEARRPQSTSVMSWNCEKSNIDHRQDPPRTCPDGKRLVVSMRFPNCWNGQNLDSPDHQSHMTYDRGESCPSTHPVQTPRVVMDVRYPTSKGTKLSFSSGPWYTGHADFINAWDQDKLEMLVRTCINDQTRIGDDLCAPLPNG